MHSDGRATLLIEGVDDYTALHPPINRNDIRLRVCFGRATLEAIVRLMDKSGAGTAHALADRDLRSLATPHSLNVTLTDYADLDAQIVLSDGMLLQIFEGFIPGAEFSYDELSEISEIVRTLAGSVGRLRRIALGGRLSLSLGDFPLVKCVSPECELDVDILHLIALKRSPDAPPLAGDLIELVWGSGGYPEYLRGHDLAKAIAVVLEKRYRKKVGWQEVERFYRAALRCGALASFSFIGALVGWGYGHAKMVLHEDCDRMLHST